MSGPFRHPIPVLDEEIQRDEAAEELRELARADDEAEELAMAERAREARERMEAQTAGFTPQQRHHYFHGPDPEERFGEGRGYYA